MKRRMQLGAIATILLRQAENEEATWNDYHLFGAGSDLGSHVQRGLDRRWLEVEEDLEAEWGCPFGEIEEEFVTRVDPKWLFHSEVGHAIERIAEAHDRWEVR